MREALTRDEVGGESHLHDGTVGHEPHEHPVGAGADVVRELVAAQPRQKGAVQLGPVPYLHVVVGAVVVILHLLQNDTLVTIVYEVTGHLNETRINDHEKSHIDYETISIFHTRPSILVRPVTKYFCTSLFMNINAMKSS